MLWDEELKELAMELDGLKLDSGDSYVGYCVPVLENGVSELMQRMPHDEWLKVRNALNTSVQLASSGEPTVKPRWIMLHQQDRLSQHKTYLHLLLASSANSKGCKFSVRNVIWRKLIASGKSAPKKRDIIDTISEGIIREFERSIL